MKILIINGVNMNMLGLRETEKYGTMTLKDLEKELYAFSFELGIDIETFQSNFEGEIVEKIHQTKDNFDGIVINAGAYTHTSVAIRDALNPLSAGCHRLLSIVTKMSTYGSNKYSLLSRLSSSRLDMLI